MRTFIKITILTLSLTLPIFAQSEIPEMTTDRPDQTESAIAMSEGILQFETGISYNERSFTEEEIKTREQNVSLFSTLFRYGIIPNLEFRFGAAYSSNLSEVGTLSSTTSGVNDLMIGAKYVLIKDGIYISNLAIIAESILPFGSNQLKPDEFQPKLILTFDREINQFAGVTINLGTEYSGDFKKYIYDYSASAGINISERLSGFLEIFGQTNKDIQPDNYLDFGITYLQTKNVQLDWYLGTTLQTGITNWFMGVGVSVRFLN